MTVDRWLARTVSRLFAAIALALLVLGSGGTTNVKAEAFTHDVPTIASVEVHQLVAAEAGPTQLSEARGRSASPHAEARGASTTSALTFVAPRTAIGPAGDAAATGLSRMDRFRNLADTGFDVAGQHYDVNPHLLNSLRKSGRRHIDRYPGSGYVATSKSPAVAGEQFAPNVYEVRAPGGVDVNATLGPRSPHPHELEVAYPGGVPSSCIVGCTCLEGSGCRIRITCRDE